MDFFEGVQKAVERFRRVDGLDNKVVRVVGNLDTDGISATSILVQALLREHIKFSVSIVKQIDDVVLKVLSNEQYETIFFLDLGSGYIKRIHDALPQKTLFVLDHHYPESLEAHERIIHVNPHLFGMSGTKDVSAAGVAYFFARTLSPGNEDLSYLALLGAIGDVQENNGFTGLNSMILEDAVRSGKIMVENGIRLYGVSTKPLYKVLEYSTNPYIPGVSGSEEGAIKFLKEIGVSYRDGLTYRRYSDLGKEEVEKLVNAIMVHKVHPDDTRIEQTYGPVYIVTEEDQDLPTRDLHEFSTLLNCCGRLGKSSLGIGACLGDNALKEKAIHLLHEYRNEVISALKWFYTNRKSDAVFEGDGVAIINAGDAIDDTIIGTLTSLISKSLVYREGTVVVGMAKTIGSDTRASFRISGFGEGKVNLRVLVHDIVGKTGGSGGGHSLAAGALVPQEKQQEFIDAVKETFAKLVLEVA